VTRLLLLLTAALLASSEPANAQTTAADHTFARAGQSNVVAPWARPTRTPKEAPGYVGGGRPFPAWSGEGRGPLDGTFGYDFVGYGLYPGRVFLGWYGPEAGPPGGPYRTDGPRVFDIFSVHPVRRALAGGEGPCAEAGRAEVTGGESHN
jgi:hypothetical protein